MPNKEPDSTRDQLEQILDAWPPIHTAHEVLSTETEIKMARHERNLIQVIDFFSGCGGMSYGFATARTRNVHFAIRGALDIDKHANATFRRMLDIDPIQADIRVLLREEKLRSATRRWSVRRDLPLLLIGCAPCQGFSSHRKKDIRKIDLRKDERNSLLEAFAKIAVRMEPDLVIMENVPEMLQERHWEHYNRWRLIMISHGYRVRARIYNLAQFGVPQERFRTLVIAARDWKHFAMPSPTHTYEEYVTVRQAIGHLPRLKAGGIDPNDSMHITSRHRAETVKLISMIPKDGGSKRSLPKGVGPACLWNVDGFRDVYGRLAWDKPAVAITARCRTPSCGRYVHPEQDRGLSVREAGLLQGFPKNYQFEGPFDDKFKQIGNAVSPIFARAIAEHLDREWIRDHNLPDREQDIESDIRTPIKKSFSSAIAAIKRQMRRSDDRRQLVLW